MVQASVPAPLDQQGAQQQQQGASSRLLLQQSTSEESAPGQAASPHLRELPVGSVQDLGGGAGGGPRTEPEESVHTCTEAIASLCIASEELAERGGRARVSPSSFPVAPPTDSHHQRSPSIPAPPGSPPPDPRIQHFSGPEPRPSYQSAPAAATLSPPHPAEPLTPSATSNPVQVERDREGESTRWSKGAS